MHVYHISYLDLPTLPESCSCIGYFDGFHRGHQVLIQQAKDLAKTNHMISAVVTFDPDPWVIFHPDQCMDHITPLSDKIQLAKALGIDAFYILDFTLDFAKLDCGAFHKLLADMNIQELVCGFDFRYAFHNTGNIHTLRTQSLFGVHVVQAIQDQAGKISSTRIENNLKEGDVWQAGMLLGYGFTLQGNVEHGFKRGTNLLQIPTANLVIEAEYILPAVGVYAGLAYTDEGWKEAMINIGNNPTFDNQTVTVEAHLLNFDQDIYDQNLRIFFIDRIRPEQKFNSFEDLKRQLHQDVQTTHCLLHRRRDLVQSTKELWDKVL